MKSEAHLLQTLKKLAELENVHGGAMFRGDDKVAVDITFSYSPGVGGVLYVVTIEVGAGAEFVEAIGQDISLHRAMHEALKELRDDLRDEVESDLEAEVLRVLEKRGL